jgi:outer membrane protein assembly factor BamB/beta-lactamase regulating signal transducer with metallopeptidase domain
MGNSIAIHLETATLQGSVFFLLVWASCVAFRRMPALWKCWLWRLVSVKFLIAMGIAISFPLAVAPDRPGEPTVGRMAGKVLKSVPQFSQTIAPAPSRLADTFAANPDISKTEPAEIALQPLELIIGFWMVGVLWILGRGVSGLLRARKILVASSEPALARVLAGMHRVLTLSAWRGPVKVRALDDLAAPALIGLVRPTIVLPADFDMNTPEAVTAALAHELAHLKRRDAGWILLAEVVKAIFWFNPLAWLACREQRVEAEIAADQLARTWTEATPKQYAQHLLEWIDPDRNSRVSVRAVPGLVSSTHELVRRMEALSLNRYGSRSAIAFGALLTPFLLLGLIPMKLVASVESGLANSPWPKFQGGPESTGRGTGAGATGKKRWSFQTGDNVESTPVIGADGTLYVGSGDDCVYAIDGVHGAKKWAFHTGATVMSSPAVGSDGTVYVGSEDGNVYALSGSNGKLKWSFPTGGLIYASPAIGTDGTIYIGSWDGNEYALDGATGAKKWAFLTAGPVTGNAAIGKDGTIYVGSHGKFVYALDGLTGAKKWSFQAGNTVNSPSISADGTIYVCSWDGNAYALDARTGADSCPAIGSDGTVYIGSNDRRVYALDSKTGDQKWEFVTNAGVFASPTLGTDGTVYIGSKDHEFYALDGATGRKKWSYDAGAGVSSSASIDAHGTLYFGTDNGNLVALH